MEKYDHKALETKWSDHWFKDNIYIAEDFSKKPKKYILVEFPYPSGSGLHCGHAYRFTLPDVYSRKLRMSGFNVLFPIGWDAFGLPAENYAVKTGVHPSITTQNAIETYRRQMRAMGYGFDWARELSTTDPQYYKWTQWIFLRMYEAGLAELREEPVWWCETLKTVLANEEVLEDDNGNKISERGGHPVEKRPLKQWVLKMPAYAEKLLAGLENIDFPDSIKTAQRNWIGKSVGAQIDFPLTVTGKALKVFTTRPDTIFGATFMVLAPEHPLVDELRGQISNWPEVAEYRQQIKNRSDLERKAAKEKTGLELKGVTASNPVSPNAKPIPLFIADYVLMDYGTGAIMAVPGHDERDFEFATKFNLPIVQTICQKPDGEACELPFTTEQGFVKLTEDVRKLTGAASEVDCSTMKEAVINKLEEQKLGSRHTTFKLRDWLFSRQRYWGEPIPLIHRADNGIEAIVHSDDKPGVKKILPLLLPDVPDYNPSSDGASPLGKNKAWVTVSDSKGGAAKRETNTMPNWAGSCWYYLRYCDPKNDGAIADPEKLSYWLPVDRYFGGSEHTTLHLLYSRFWHQFLYDQGLVPTPEPYAWRINGGLLLGPDNQKMSKSLGNVIIPDDKIEAYGADALRIYINFMGPYDATMPWSENGLKACRKLVDRVFDLSEKVSEQENEASFVKAYHKLIKRVSSMIDNLKTNTSVSEFMIFVREAEKQPHINRDIWLGFLKAFAPFAVFACEELWQRAHGFSDWKPENSVHLQAWPEHDEALARDEVVAIGVQVNGKVRDQIEVALTEDEASVRERALALPGVAKWTDGKPLKKFIYVPAKIVNIVV